MTVFGIVMQFTVRPDQGGPPASSHKRDAKLASVLIRPATIPNRSEEYAERWREIWKDVASTGNEPIDGGGEESVFIFKITSSVAGEYKVFGGCRRKIRAWRRKDEVGGLFLVCFGRPEDVACQPRFRSSKPPRVRLSGLRTTPKQKSPCAEDRSGRS